MTDRKKALAQIWRETHRDYKGKLNGVKTIMVNRKGATCLVPLEQLTEDEIKKRVATY